MPDFNPTLAKKLAEQCEAEPPHLRTEIRAALPSVAEQLRAACAEVERLRSRIKCSCEAQYDHVVAERDSLSTKLSTLEQENGRMRAERDEARGLAMEALGVIEDWPDCDEKAQHTNTIVELEGLFVRLTKPSEETLQPFRDALATTKKDGQA